MSPTSVATTTLGNVIRLARTDNGWSQTRLGEEIRVAQSIISAWENGRAMPSVTNLLRLADALDRDRAAFLDAVAVEDTRRRP